MKRLLASCAVAGLSACVATPAVRTPSPTLPSAPVLPSASRTVAFPTLVPTPTWTSGPTLTPTANLSPDFGLMILDDPMDDSSAWELTTAASGGAALTDGRLTLSVRMPRGTYTAHRVEPVVADFYAEVDAYTEVCSPGDELGLTARGGGLGEQYRFLIGCDGTARITRVLEEGSRALTLRVASPVILPGAPAHNHLAVWLHGLDLKFFINGDEILSVRDAALTHGNLGVIARAGAGGQVSVGFDDLLVFTLVQPGPTPSPDPAPPPPTSTATR